MNASGAFFGVSSLQTWLPAMYRPIVIFCIGVWGWGFNLFLLDRQHIDSYLLLQAHPTYKHVKPYGVVFILALFLTILIMANVGWYWLTLDTESPSVWIPASCYFSALVFLLWPGKWFFRKERVRFLRMLRRLFSLHLFSTVYFSDIILADLLTSFSNVFGDLYSTACIAFTHDTQDNACHRNAAIPLLISLPYLIRLRQCLSEFIESGGQCKRHLLNAIKYASSLPVILISIAQKQINYQAAAADQAPTSWWMNETNVFRLWMVCVFVNSMYSFWWDISVDWNLIHVTTRPVIANHSHGYNPHHHATSTPVVRIRRQRIFNDVRWYYAAAIVDFLLRTTWSLKLSAHLYIQRLEASTFLMELLEVARRWVWVMFRMESEWVKRFHNVLPTTNVAMREFNTVDSQPNPASKLMPIREEDDNDNNDASHA